jgi:hypothetical protein
MSARKKYTEIRLLIFIVALAFSPALAQTHDPIDVDVATERWASENNVFVTKSARDQLHELLVASLSNSVGLPKESLSAVGQELRDTGSLRFARVGPPTRSPGLFSVPTTVGAVQVTSEQASVLAKLLSMESISSWLARFPSIRVIVQPAPPVDYNIAINGEKCPPDKGLYRVPAGLVDVQVTRFGKAPCVWRGSVLQGQTQDVSCSL